MRFDTRGLVRISTAAVLTLALAACGSNRKAPLPTTTAPTTSAPPATQTTPTGPGSSSSALPPPNVNAGAPAPGSTQDFVVNVGDRVYFDTDASEVRADAQSLLDAQAAWLTRYPQVTVRIEGNADERGTREYNFALGARRANAVRDYLIRKGVAGSRIETVSYGKERPIAEGPDESSWSRNRNAHTAIVGGAR